MAKTLVIKLAMVLITMFTNEVLIVTPPAHAYEQLDSGFKEFDDDDVTGFHFFQINHINPETEHEQYDEDDYDPNDYSTEVEKKPAEQEYVTPEPGMPSHYNPCHAMDCGVGQYCQFNEDDQSMDCVCITECPLETDPRSQVCTLRNETLNSACQVFRQTCLCAHGKEGCLGNKQRINYHGPCREILECREEELVDFPRRMREWLLVLLLNSASHNSLPHAFLELEMSRMHPDIESRWRNAAVWKWCELDVYPRDLLVSWNELFPIRAHLLAHENCIVPFLKSCDGNGDGKINLQEWGYCLELGELTGLCALAPNEDGEFYVDDLYESYA